MSTGIYAQTQGCTPTREKVTSSLLGTTSQYVYHASANMGATKQTKSP